MKNFWKDPNSAYNSEEYRKKRSEQVKGKKNYFYGKRFVGKKNPFYGRTHTEVTKKKISLANKGRPSSLKGIPKPREQIEKAIRTKRELARRGLLRYCTPHNKGVPCTEEARQKNIRTNRIRCSHPDYVNPFKGKTHTPKMRKHLSRVHTKKWQDKEYAMAKMEEFKRKPNKIEKQFLALLNKYYPKEWKYVGDGNCWIVGKNPDFLNVNGQKKLIELFGDYWHTKKEEKERINHFAKYGFKTLVVWQSELKNKEQVLDRINNFHKM